MKKVLDAALALAIAIVGVMVVKRWREVLDMAGLDDKIRNLTAQRDSLVDQSARLEGDVAAQRRRKTEMEMLSQQLNVVDMQVNLYQKALERLTSNNVSVLHTEATDTADERERVAVMVMIRNQSSFGMDNDITGLLNVIDSIDYPQDLLTVNILVYYDYQLYQDLVREVAAAGRRGQIRVYHTGNLDYHRQSQAEAEEGGSATDRQRSLLAVYRNKMIMRALSEEEYVLWLAPNVKSIPSRLLADWIDLNCGIVACVDGSVRMPYNNQLKWGYDTMCNPEPDTASEQRRQSLQRLLVVGGPLVLVKSDLHRQGVNFPTYHLIGSLWNQAGYEGIDTEGLCYMALAMGFDCWGTDDHVPVHTLLPVQDLPHPDGMS